jgi:hypothetical protein
MNPYVVLGSGIGTSEAAALASRLAIWHDAMVAHERALRAGRNGIVCDDECPHVEARMLWAEAVVTYGSRAQELAFLRSRATGVTRQTLTERAPATAHSEDADHGRPSTPRPRMVTHDVPERSLPSESVSSQTRSTETWT